MIIGLNTQASTRRAWKEKYPTKTSSVDWETAYCLVYKQGLGTCAHSMDYFYIHLYMYLY